MFTASFTVEYQIHFMKFGDYYKNGRLITHVKRRNKLNKKIYGSVIILVMKRVTETS